MAISSAAAAHAGGPDLAEFRFWSRAASAANVPAAAYY
jgi:hypothetical protein